MDRFQSGTELGVGEGHVATLPPAISAGCAIPLKYLMPLGGASLAAVRGHLHERAGDLAVAVTNYRRAADATTSTPERNYLLLKAARLDEA